MLTRSLVSLISAATLALLFASRADANLKFDMGFSSGYTSNSFLDSTDALDRHVISTGAVKYYPLSWLEASLSGDISTYGEVPNLSSRLGRVGITAVPIGQNSRFSLSLSGSFDGRRYRRAFSKYDSDDFNSRVAVGYRLMPRLSLRLGGTFQTTSYLATESGDKQATEVFAGFNSTPFGSNSLDVEWGFGWADYRSIDLSKVKSDGFVIDRLMELPQLPVDSLLKSGTIPSFYISPRWSRPLGSKTGINATFLYRHFGNTQSTMVFASATSANGLLSPWTSVWEGIVSDRDD